MNIRLEPLQSSHAGALYVLTDNNREYLRQWLPWLDHIQAKEDTERFIDKNRQQAALGKACNFAVFHNDSLCGVACFHAINKAHRTGSIGYWLAESFTGKGIMLDAVSLLLRTGFVEFHLHRIEIRCATGNTKSRAIPEKLGFTLEGQMRECEWLYNKHVDHAIYALLAHDYMPSPTT
tara:strand:+ start:360 stop:893 length:534 start_codon:yes stop_codon:yes gene_type:complete